MGKVDLPIIAQKNAGGIGKVALSMIAIGLSAGLTLIAAAKKFGDMIAENRIKEEEK